MCPAPKYQLQPPPGLYQKVPGTIIEAPEPIQHQPEPERQQPKSEIRRRLTTKNTPSQYGRQATIDSGIVHLTTNEDEDERTLTTDNMQLQEWYDDDNEDYDEYELKHDALQKTEVFTRVQRSDYSHYTPQQLKNVCICSSHQRISHTALRISVHLLDTSFALTPCQHVQIKGPKPYGYRSSVRQDMSFSMAAVDGLQQHLTRSAAVQVLAPCSTKMSNIILSVEFFPRSRTSVSSGTQHHGTTKFGTGSVFVALKWPDFIGQAELEERTEELQRQLHAGVTAEH
eukprot:5058328-Amphidinium_carterae.1